MALRDILSKRAAKKPASSQVAEPGSAADSSMPPVRVLVLDDDNTDFTIARECLREIEDTVYEIDWAPTYEDGAELLRANRYDVCLLDYRLGSRSGLDFMRDELVNGTKVPAVMLTGEGSRAVDEQALRFGAAGFLVKSDTNPAEMDRAIRYAIQSHRAKLAMTGTAPTRVPCKIVSLVGAKGGVGTTTVALNVAVALAERGMRVVAVDLKPMFGTLAQQLGVEASSDLGDLIQVPADELADAQLEACLEKHPSGLAVLAAPETLAGHRPIQPEHVDWILGVLGARSDFIVLDLNRDLLPATKRAVASSHVTVLVTSREPTALAAARLGGQILRAWNPEGVMAAVVVDREALPFTASGRQIAASLDLDFYGYIAADKDLFYEVLSEGNALVQTHKSHFAAQALIKVAEALIELEVCEIVSEAGV